MTITNQLISLITSKQAIKKRLELTDDIPFKDYVKHMAKYVPFSPRSVFNGKYGLWYDISDISTLFQDAAGTIPVTAHGQPVGKLLDKSGNNNHASQTKLNSRPIYKTDGNLSWLEFDGIDDDLQVPNFSLHLYSTSIISVKTRRNPNTGIGWFIEQSSDGNTKPGFYIQNTTGATYLKRQNSSYGTTTDVQKAGVKAPTWAGMERTVASYEYAGSASTMKIFKDGVQQTIAAPSSYPSLSNVLVTDRLYINSRGGVTIFSACDMYGLILVDGILETSVRNALEQTMYTQIQDDI